MEYLDEIHQCIAIFDRFGPLRERKMLPAMVGKKIEECSEMYRTLVGFAIPKKPKMLPAMVGIKIGNVPHPGGDYDSKKARNAPSYGGGQGEYAASVQRFCR